jgi:hypothetical protein
VPATLPSTRYLTEVDATLEHDSAGRVLQEHVQSRGVIALQLRRDSLGNIRANGMVDSFTVRGLEDVLSPPASTDNRTGRAIPVVPVTPLSVLFDAVLDERALRVVTRPPLANECDRPEGGATNLVREMMVRVPKVLSIGTAWSDSTIAFMCRLSVPITTRTRSSYIVDRTERVANRIELVVKRVTDTQLDGNLKSTWRTVTLSGVGHTTQMVHLDAITGVVRGIEGDGVLTVRLSDSSRRDGSGTQEVRQKTTSRTTVRP